MHLQTNVNFVESNRISKKWSTFRFYAPLCWEMFNSHLIAFVPSHIHPKKPHLCGSPFSSFMAGNCTVIPIPPLLAHLLHLYVGSGDHNSESCIDRFVTSLNIRPCVLSLLQYSNSNFACISAYVLDLHMNNWSCIFFFVSEYWS